MQQYALRGTAHKATAAKLGIAGLLLAATANVFAQAAPPATGAAPSEAARRAAESPFRFILLNAQPVKPRPAPPVEKPAAPVETAKRPPPAEVTAAAKPTAPAPTASASLAPASAVPEPTAVAIASPKAPEPAPIVAVRRELIPVRTDPPRLPNALMRLQPSGKVRMYFEVNADGSTGNVKVVGSTNRDLNRASIDAVQGWKFEPIDDPQAVETELVYNYQ